MSFNIIKSLGIISFIFLNSIVSAQYNDFGIWNSMELKRDLPKGFDLGLNLQLRLEDNARRAGSIIGDFDVKYKVFDWLKIAGTYRLSQSNDLENYRIRHRFAFDVSMDEKIGEFDVKYRIRYQAQDSNIFSDENDNFYDKSLRHKFTVERKIIKKTTGSMDFELFTARLDRSYPQITDWRWKIGLDRKISKREALTLGYMIQSQVFTDEPLTEYVVLLGYSLELKKKKKKKKSLKPKITP